MICKEIIYQYIEEWINNKPFFLVDLNIGPDFSIVIEIESIQGNVSIGDCAELRHLSSVAGAFLADEKKTLLWSGLSRHHNRKNA